METASVPAETVPARRRVPARTRLDFWFDGVLLIAYTLAYSLRFTGLAHHLQAHPDPGLGARRGALAMDRQRRPPPAGPLPAVPVKFVRQLAAVLLTVAVIVALGMAWGHASGAGPSFPGGVVFGGRGSGPGLSLSDSGDLFRTAELEAVIMAVVIAASAVRRRRRRARRAAVSPRG